MSKVFGNLNDIVVDGRILLNWMKVGIYIYSDSTKCPGFLNSSATVHFTITLSVALVRRTVATPSHIDTSHSVAL